MAKKKDKPQVINKIQELNLEIDYDKLAEAIVKAQNKMEETPDKKEKIGFWKSVGLIICNKEAKNGKKTSYLLAEILGWLFNAIALICVLLAGVSVYSSILVLDWKIAVLPIIFQVIFCIFFLFLLLSIALIFRAVANEIKAEKDRNYIVTLFFGFTSLASLIVALVALFKEVG